MDTFRSSDGRRQRGVSLIEALAALVLLMFAIVGTSMLSSTTIETNRLSRRLGIATQLAHAKLEELRSSAFTGIVSGEDGPLSATGTPSGDEALYRRTWTVLDDTPAAGTKRIAVRVTWPGAWAGGELVVETLAVDP